MNQDTTLHRFANDPENHLAHLEIKQVERLLNTLAQAERPETLQAFIWHLLRVVKREPDLEIQVLQTWEPDEEVFAELLEDAGPDGASIVLTMAQDEPRSKKLLDRLLMLSDELGTLAHISSSDPWERISRLPMVALLAEQQLDQLVEAVVQGRQWKDPAEILDRDGDGDQEIDLESIIALAQARMIKTNGSGEALNLVMLRLLNWVDRDHDNIH